MPKRIDSDALGPLNKSLGLTGAGSPITELTDGVVDQALNVGPIIRRGRSIAGSTGIFTAIMRNIHSAANSVSSLANVYDLSGVGVIAPWPDPMPAQFDIWLLAASVHRASGSGTLAGQLFINFSVAQQGWGIDSAGVAVVSLSTLALAAWDGQLTVSTIVTGKLADGNVLARPGIRLPRSLQTQLVFETTSSAMVTFDLDLVLGVFPIALGQDGII